MFALCATLINFTSISYSNQSAASESDIFLPVIPGTAGNAYFYFTNNSRRVSTLFAKIVEKQFPNGPDDPNWFTQFCYSNICFLEDGESPNRIQPGRQEEMHITLWPMDDAKVGDKAKVTIEVWPTSDPKLKERITVYAIVVNKKTIKMVIDSKQVAVTTGKETKNITLDVPPMIISGRTMVPLRFIGEELGAGIDWEAKDRRVTYQLGDMNLMFWVDQKTARINIGPKYTKNVALDVAPIIVQSRTLVPVRYVSEFLGAEVGWNASTRTVTVDFPKVEESKV